MTKKQKLELTWIGKDKQPKLEPRILIEDPDKSYGDKNNGNMLIHGDNLLALKALEQDYAGKIKCIYIDPPFNTGQAFEHYDDGLEHSLWLNLIKNRLEILRVLLSNEGTLLVHIDDNELGYLIVVLDELFGRENRKYIVTFKQSAVSGPKAINPGLVTTGSYILIYSKESRDWMPKKIYVPTKRDNRYTKYIVNYQDNYEDWQLANLRDVFADSIGIPSKDLKKKYPTKDKLEIELEKFVMNEPERVVRTARIHSKDINQNCRPQFEQSKIDKDTIFKGTRPEKSDMFFLNGEQLIFYSTKVKKIDNKMITGQAASTIWDDLLSNNLHNEGQVAFSNGKKPEFLIKRILELCTNQDDWVLDSFAGSGTTLAVAHKMNRKWIGIELGDHCYTHFEPRLKRVCNGIDQSGISKAINWKGGGGFKFYELAPSLLQKDHRGNWIINKEYNAQQLASSMAKHECFKFHPDEAVFWKQGFSTENDYIFTTTEFLTVEYLDVIHDQMKPDESLLICCTKHSIPDNRYENITVKKIPNMLLGRCEFGKEDYSLNIVDMPIDPEAPEFIPAGPTETKKEKSKKESKKIKGGCFNA